MTAEEQAKQADAIRVETSEDSPIQRTLQVEVAAERVGRAFDRAYQDLAKRAQVKGFRPGKVPRSVLERLYGPSLAEQIEQTLVGETLADAIEQAGLEPVAEPAVESAAAEAGEVFRYTARVEVKPPIELPDLAGLPASRPRVDVSDEDVDRELEALRQRQTALLEEPEGTALAQGHVASVDFFGRVDGKPFEGGTGRGVDVEMGSGHFLPGFEDQLLGAVAGEDREVNVSFPEDYGNAELAGKQASFAVHVNAVKRREVPELDDEFAKDLGDFEDLEALRERVRSDLTAARERAAKAQLHRSVVDSLIERTAFDVPPGMIERRLEGRLRSAHQRFESQLPHDVLHEQLERWREEWRGEAEREVRQALLLEAVTQAQGLQVLPEDVDARMTEMAEQQGVDAARLRQALGGDAFERALEGQLADKKALEFLVARAKVEETADT
jgi:trigger factor